MEVYRGSAPDFKTSANFRKDNGKAIQCVRQFVVRCQQPDGSWTSTGGQLWSWLYSLSANDRVGVRS